MEKIILFFFKAESIALGIWLVFRAYEYITNSSVLSVKSKTDTDVLWGLTVLAIFATLVYSWTL